MVLDRIKSDLYFVKLNLFFNKGLKEGKIVPFDDAFYDQMSNVIIATIPVKLHIKYLRPKFGEGMCYDRSLYMFFCFDNALLVRGDNKDLELKYGKDYAGHGWIEIGDYVYDPSLMMRFDRDWYYRMYEPTNVKKHTKDEYIAANKSFYEEIMGTTIDDFMPGGKKRYELLMMMPLLLENARLSQDDHLLQELNAYLKRIEYDAKEIRDTFYSDVIQGR